MDSAHLIPKMGERIERLDTALFSAPASCWRYPACIIRKLRMDRQGKRLWFKMKNISLLEDQAVATHAFLFCYNKRYNYYITVEGKASIAGLLDELKPTEGWLDPILRAQRTYLIRLDIDRVDSRFRHGLPPDQPVAAVAGSSRPLSPRSHWPAGLLKKPPKIHWPSSFGFR